MKILLLDIETAPNTAYVWRLFKENIPLQRLKETSYVLCWAAKWLDEPDVMFASTYKGGVMKMLTKIHALLDEADVVIHYNGKAFDIPILNKEFLIYGLPPPSPCKHVDLLQVAKDKFRFVSNKLDHVAQQLDLGQKHDTSFELWIGCMNDDPTSWVIMEEYNKQDVILLERVYRKFRPWIRNHPNTNLFAETPTLCPNCGSVHIQKRGFTYTTIGKYQRFWCKDCGNWSRNGINLHPQQKETLRNVA
jgi:hypothetical protein